MVPVGVVAQTVKRVEVPHVAVRRGHFVGPVRGPVLDARGVYTGHGRYPTAYNP